ncbi:MAG: TfuA-like protein [bacterium]
MKVVFAGPTISHHEVQQHLDCICLPPIRHGDLIELIDQKPEAIGIIDGYFEGAPSVWHKEILYALDQGVHVYGSASMGALRAAELHQFGMRGVGQIFEWYRDMIIEDDDEVAVLHGPAEVDFAVASEPMVSIRASLHLAATQGVIDQSIHDALIARLKSIFYKKRSWHTVNECAVELLDQSTQARLVDWLDQHRIDLKKADAIAMLRIISNEHQHDKPAFESGFNFEWTNVWDTAYRTLTTGVTSEQTLTENDLLVLDQLRLNQSKYEKYRDKALLTWICDNQVNTATENDHIQSELKAFRKRNLLHSRPQLIDHMSRVDLDEEGLTAALRGALRVKQVLSAAGDLRPGIVLQLKLEGGYLDYLDVAERKRSALTTAGVSSDQPGILRPQLLSWYAKHRLGEPMPDDLTEILSALDLGSVDDFYRLIAEDYLYWQISK